MDGVLSDGRRGRLWMCKVHEGHALGIVMQVQMQGYRVSRLLLFRSALSLGDIDDGKTIELPEVRTMGSPEGTMHDIECNLCDAKRTWWMGAADLDRLMHSRKLRRMQQKEKV